jgi:hypothetical protein
LDSPEFSGGDGSFHVNGVCPS